MESLAGRKPKCRGRRRTVVSALGVSACRNPPIAAPAPCIVTPMQGDHPLRRAVPLFLLAGVCFSTLDATAKYLVQEHTLFLVVWARYAGQMLVITPITWQRGGAGFWRTHHLRMQLARSLCLVTATACFFGSLRFLPLAE